MNINIGREIYSLIATRNRPLLTALDLCIEQLTFHAENNPAVQYALECAVAAARQERDFQRDSKSS